MHGSLADELNLQIKDHLEKEHDDVCAYCGQYFAPDEIVIEKNIHGRKWKFCSEDCYRDFNEASNFKDEDLDSKEPEGVVEDNEEPSDEY